MLLATAANEIEKRTVVDIDLLEEGFGAKKLAISNQLVEANYRLSLTQLRLIWMFGAIIEATDESLSLYRIPVNQIIKRLGMETNKGAHAQLRRAAQGLVGSVVSIPKSNAAFEPDSLEKGGGL
ncbi:replication initiation protein [Rhodothermus sp. AH-315-K08]|nr:replication initiation protein [Rhodothermus sp. AH-315-K08]